jgi:DNA-binding response OmpR family regulator
MSRHDGTSRLIVTGPIFGSSARSLRSCPVGSPRMSVLVLDDDAAIRASLREALEPEFIVLEARDGAEALASSRLVHPAIVLMDLRLPGGMSGADFVREYRRDGGCARLLLFTADPDARELARSLQADGVIEKPFDLDELTATLRGPNQPK